MGTPSAAAASPAIAPTAVTAGNGNVAPNAAGSAKLQQSGQLRWISSTQSPDQLWPLLKDFLKESGLTLTVENPATGLLETDWAENRAHLKEDFVRKTVGRFFKNLYDSGERDRYTLRIERTPNGGSEIYISHHGLSEIYTSAPNDRQKTTKWQSRPSDPELEAIMLTKLLGKLGGNPAENASASSAAEPSRPAASAVTPMQAQALTNNAEATSLTGKARLLPGANDAFTTIELDDPQTTAWRRILSALDRAGYTIDSKDSSQKLLRISVPTSASSSSSSPLYRLQLRDNGDKTIVQIQDSNGVPAITQAAKDVARSLLKVL
jgi:outer membrane protein assembly factor BamC